MPEGPSIVILKELVQPFKKKKIIEVGGNTKLDKERLLNKQVIDFKSWGKHFLICCNGFTVRIHFMLFGSYRINEKKDSPARLSLKFKNGELNFYTCLLSLLKKIWMKYMIGRPISCLITGMLLLQKRNSNNNRIN